MGKNKSTEIKKTPLHSSPAMPSAGTLNYQSGFNANRQAVNSGQNNASFLRESLTKQPVSSADGARGVQDVQKGMQQNSLAQMNRGYAAQNAQQSMNDMADRSQLMQQGLANQSKIYSDISNRYVDQMSLASKINEAMIRNKFAVMQQQAAKQFKNPVGIRQLRNSLERLNN